MTALGMCLALAALIGIARLLWWQRTSPAPAKPWRLALLAAFQIVTAGLLWLTLEPPPIAGNGGTLVVATAGAPRLAMLAAGDALVALPEAPALPGVARVPDLATALRRHPGTRALRIIGTGLPPRDQIATGLPLAFDPPPLPRGLVSLTAPAPVAPGAAFRVGGNVNDVPGGRITLLDPAGRGVASAALGPSGEFTLAGTAGAAGPAEFTLRITDAARRPVETAMVPVVAAEPVLLRALIIAGAAGPDLKFLRRWATDAGLGVTASIAAGNGLDIGDATPRLDAASLAKLDLLILDERSWAAIGAGGRTQVLNAVRGGLGVLLRVTGPLPDATRREWAALGFAADDATSPLRLLGEGPVLTQVTTRPGRDLAALPAAPAGHWRNLGRGRIALWPVTDLYTLVLAGEGPRHGAIWSAIVATIARPQAASPPRLSPDAAPGARLTICNLPATASVRHPDGAITTLIVDAGCAAFWPRLPGWHELRGTAATPFLVTPPSPARAAVQARTATLALVQPGSSATAAPPARGPSWPWFLAWLAASALLWWFERSRYGRAIPG